VVFLAPATPDHFGPIENADGGDGTGIEVWFEGGTGQGRVATKTGAHDRDPIGINHLLFDQQPGRLGDVIVHGTEVISGFVGNRGQILETTTQVYAVISREGCGRVGARVS